MHISHLSFWRVPLQYLQDYSSKIQQAWHETYGPHFKQLQENLVQICCFKRSVATIVANDTASKTDGLVAKTLQPKQTVPPTTIDLDQVLPLDPKTVCKKMDNGFTYYVRHNAYPSKDTASLRLVVRAGSTDEQEHERGLAHFLEHLVFFETENFGKHEISRYLESKGVNFVADQNAHTGFNETVYKFNIPLNDPELLDKALYILKEMATKAKIAESAVEEERIVILDEISNECAGNRYHQKLRELLLEGTPYPNRQMHGLKKIIQECTSEHIRAFYKRTYLPQNMALVAVGDFDQKQVEGLIQKHFGDIPSSTEPPIKHNFTPIKRTEAQFLCHSDPEALSSLLEVYYPLKMGTNDEKFTVENVLQGMINSLYQIMFNRRLSEIITDSDSPPFIYAAGNREDVIEDLVYYHLILLANDGELPIAYKRLLLELKRVQEHGFLPEELESAKKTCKAGLEHQEKEKGQTSTQSLVKKYVSHFTDGSPYFEPSTIIDLEKKLLECITLDHIHAWSKILTKNKEPIISTHVPDSSKDTVSPEILKKASEEAALESVEPYVTTTVDRPLLRHIPNPGNIVDTVVFEKVGVTKLVLENGMHVYIRPSTQNEDRIRMLASTIGGELSVPYEKRAAAEIAANLCELSGQADLTSAQFRKLLAETAVKQNIFTDDYTTSFTVTSSKKDLETAFQVLYNTFADRTPRQEVFNTIKKAHINLAKLQYNRPESQLHAAENALCTQNHPRFQPISAEEYEKAEYQDCVDFLNKQLQNPGDFHLVITGNIDVETAKELVKKYVAGIPGQRSHLNFESFNYPSYEYPSGIVTKEIEAGIASRCQTHISFPAPAQDTYESRRIGNFTAALLTMHLLNRLRIEKPENYAVGCKYAATKLPGQEKSNPSSMELIITGLPENIRELNQTVIQEIEKIQKEGFSQEEIEAYRTQMKEAFRKSRDLDDFWLLAIDGMSRWGWNIDTIVEDASRLIDQLDQKTTQEYAKKLFPLNRYVQVTLLPKQ